MQSYIIKTKYIVWNQNEFKKYAAIEMYSLIGRYQTN